MIGVSTLAAQSPPPSRFALGFSLGPAFTTASLGGHLRALGPAGSIFVRWSAMSRLAVTLEALASHFGESADHIHAPCSPEAGPFGCHRPVGPVSVGALAGGIQWEDSTVALGERGSYLVLGVGAYHALDHPTALGATRLGWTAGFVFVLRPKPRVALEVRYHHVPRWPDERLSLIPTTLSLSW